jgi:hypothetical protein
MTSAPISAYLEMASGISLDGLFRANAALRPDAIALADPANRLSFTDGAPVRLSYAEASKRVERIARRLGSFGMPAGSVVAVQLPNIVEAVISILAILRAGYVAAPVPALWRRSDLVAALSGVAPKALITLARLESDRPAEIICEAAAELFDLSFPCAFGGEIPDGFVALDEDDDTAATDTPPASAADAVSLITFDTDANGFFATGRSDAQWLAAGLATFLEAKIETSDTIVTTLPPNSLAAISASLVPWLLSGGTLELIHGFAPDAVVAAGAAGKTHLVAPAAALPDIAAQRKDPFSSCIAVHRGARTLKQDFSSVPSKRIVDLHGFGEVAVVALQREDARRARPIPVGGISAPSATVGTPIVIEARIAEGQVCLRGPMLPRLPFPASGAMPRLLRDREGFIHTGFHCHSDGNGGLLVDAGPDKVVAVGGLRFGLNDLRSRFSSCGDDIKVMAVADPLLGQRLRIESADPDATIAAMEAAGHSRLVIDATVGAGARRAAS